MAENIAIYYEGDLRHLRNSICQSGRGHRENSFLQFMAKIREARLWAERANVYIGGQYVLSWLYEEDLTTEHFKVEMRKCKKESWRFSLIRGSRRWLVTSEKRLWKAAAGENFVTHRAGRIAKCFVQSWQKEKRKTVTGIYWFNIVFWEAVWKIILSIIGEASASSAQSESSFRLSLLIVRGLSTIAGGSRARQGYIQLSSVLVKPRTISNYPKNDFQTIAESCLNQFNDFSVIAAVNPNLL